MHPDLTPISERVERLCDRAGRSGPSRALLAEIETTLCDGYAEALEGDAWAAQVERRMQELIVLIPADGAARELRALAKHHGDFQISLVLLRRWLVRLRAEFDRLGAASMVDVA